MAAGLAVAPQVWRGSKVSRRASPMKISSTRVRIRTEKADRDSHHASHAMRAAGMPAMPMQVRALMVGIASADAELAKGTAEAEVIRLRGLAEAEAKEKLAEAFKHYGEAAILDVIVNMLPELAGKIAEPIAAVDKITVVDTGRGEGGG